MAQTRHSIHGDYWDHQSSQAHDDTPKVLLGPEVSPGLLCLWDSFLVVMVMKWVSLEAACMAGDPGAHLHTLTFIPRRSPWPRRAPVALNVLLWDKGYVGKV